MSKKKVAAVFSAVIVLIAAAFAVVYFFVLKQNSGQSDYEKLREGMKAWDNSVPGISLYIPEDYTKTENDFYVTYKKENASVSLTSEEVQNDLENYAYYAVNQYKNVTDSLNIKEEHNEDLLNTTAHIAEFDYSLNLDSGVKTYSCISAYVMGSGRAYVLTCVSPPEDFPLHREEFIKTYRTMVLVDLNNKE